MILNKATFSKVHGVSRAAVTLAVQSNPPKLVEDVAGMIDDQNPVNAAWISRRSSKAGSKPNVQKKESKIKSKEKEINKSKIIEKETVQNVEPDIDEILIDEDDSGYEDVGALTIAKVRADIRFKQEQADAAHQKRLERMRELVDRDLVRKAFATFGSGIKIHFIEMPQRIVPRISAMVRSGESEIVIQKYLEAEFSAAIQKIKVSIKDFSEEK